MKQKNLVLMVVAVGCGLVAAFLTSQMNAKPQVDTIEVLVATKDLPVGTMIAKEDLKDGKLIKRKSIPKDAVPPGIVETEEELVDKRLSRAIRAEEMVNRADLTKGGVVTIPPGMNMTSLQVGGADAVTGFVGPGSRVDVLGTVSLGEKITALPILVNMLVLAVDTQTTYNEKGVFPTVNTVSFAVNRKQALLIKLAKARGCALSLLLRNPEDKVNELDKNYDIDTVIKLLQDEKRPARIANPDGDGTLLPDTDPDQETPAPVSPAGPSGEMVKVPYAVADIPAGTQLTTDLIADKAKFGVRELPKEVAADAVTDLNDYLGQVLRNGLGKGQWVTKSLVGGMEPKPGPREEFNPAKGGPSTPKPAAVQQNPTHDLSVHTGSGTKVFRYEEVSPGEWRLLGEVRPGARPAPPAARPAPPATPGKVD